MVLQSQTLTDSVPVWEGREQGKRQAGPGRLFPHLPDSIFPLILLKIENISETSGISGGRKGGKDGGRKEGREGGRKEEREGEEVGNEREKGKEGESAKETELFDNPLS